VLAALSPWQIVSSSAGRAVASAGYLEQATGLTASRDDRLREIYLGTWQGLTREEVGARFPDEFAAWMRGEDVRCGGGETYAEVGVRAGEALREALVEVPGGGLLVVVTHGGSARAVIGSMLALPPEHWWRFAPLGNARWSLLSEGTRGWRLAEHNAGVTERFTALTESGDDTRTG
jgi:broad specificity phosphatase PhoE